MKEFTEEKISAPTEKERDRRYSVIRGEMKKRSLDCLIITGFSGRWNMMNANVRYVSNYSDNLSTVSYVVFPLEGEGSYITQMMVKESLRKTSWVKDIRPFSTRNASVMIERIKQLGLQEGKIGIVGAGYRGAEVVGMPYNVYLELVKAFPKAVLVDVTEMFTTLRYVKSDEEIELLRQSTAVCDNTFEDMLKITKPGMKENEWFAELQRATYYNGAEQPYFIIGKSGPMPTKSPEYFKNDSLFTSRTITSGDVILSEFSPNVGGYMAQTLQLISLGRAHPEVERIVGYSIEMYKKLIPELKPGHTNESFLKTAAGFAEEYRKELGDDIQALTPIAHGVGLMAPEPTSGEGHDIGEFKAGMVMMLEIGPRSQRSAYTWLGTPFVLTEDGPKSLTRIPFEDRALAVV